MMKMISKIKKMLLFFSFFLFIPIVHAGSATTYFSGKNTTYIGENIEVILYVGATNNANSGLAAFGGKISYDSSKLTLVGKPVSIAPFTIQINNNMMAGFGANYITGNTGIMKFTFKTISLGTATISYSGSSQPDSLNQPVAISGCQKTITITEPPSTNANLASLSLSSGSLPFNKNTTEYKINVEENVASIQISASAEDTGAKVSGTGNKNLSLGDNKFSIVVTAPSGDKKTYTLLVNRKDNRSSNNFLSSLTISSGTLSPKFNKKTTTYLVNVPFDIQDVDVVAKAEDPKSKVSVSGGKNLVAEKTSQVIVKVSAENGSLRTYTIQVTRGKAPNKPLSNINSLKSLKPSVGELSPVFDKDCLSYEIQVAFDVRELNFETVLEDEQYSTLKVDGPKTLSVGKNKFSIVVWAEDKSTKTYQIVVTRAMDPNALNSTNTNLSSIQITGGILNQDFHKNQHIYFYKGKGNLKIEAVSEDENSKVVLLEENRVYTIFVEAPNGDVASYVFIPEKSSFISPVLSFVGGVFFSFASIYLISFIRKKYKKIEVKKDKGKKRNKNTK